ncbi:hypothetical protein D3C71_1936470 [compost metagenome]
MRNNNRHATPATNPQNADPIPAIDNPEAVTRNVTSAGSRSASSRIATARLLPIVPSSAIPASAATSSFGNAANTAATVAPNSPTTI